MKKLITLFIPFLLISACAASQQGTGDNGWTLDKAEVISKTDQLVKDYMDLGIFSGVVLIAEMGKPFYHKAFGLADREKNIPNTLTTRFDIGSMNKSFTKVAIVQLVEEGRLSFDDKMTKYLSGFSQPGVERITVRHLVDHESGFGDYVDPHYFDLAPEEKTIEKITGFARSMDLEFEPGTDQMYSNTGYVLLGAIIEKITGKSYAQNITERIIKPLDLKQTHVHSVYKVPERSVGYMKMLKGYRDNLDMLSDPKPDGGFWATATDVLTFYRAFFHGDQLIEPESRETLSLFKMIQPYYDIPLKGIPLAGGANGLNTVHVEMLHEQISIIVLANMDEPVAENIGIGILDIIRNKTPEPAKLPAILNVHKVYKEKGISYLKDNFDEVTANFHPADPKEWILNQAGYDYLFEGDFSKAIELFTLNTELFPRSPNVWDSLGEAWLEKGDRQKALQYYKKALALDPEFPSAKKMVSKLEG